jgi:hypothetical protein
MMTCFKNLFKHLKNCYQTKMNREMSQHNSVFCKCTEFFFQKKKKNWWNVPFSYLFFTFVQNIKPQKKNLSWPVYLNVFNHIVTFWKNYMTFCIQWFAMIIFGKSSFIFRFVGYGLVTKSFGAWCTFEEMVEKSKCQKMNVNLFTTKWEESSHLVSKGQNPLKLLLYTNDSQYYIPAL